MMRRFLVCHDYGTGGLWWWIEAQSPDQITTAFRDVLVFEEPPAWWNDEVDRNVERFRLGDTAKGALAMLARS